ncbi:MAG: hypothetical protein ACPGJS_08380 [Flammeovirgaceae bacterium]
MKKNLFFVLVFCLISFLAKSQQVSVEKNTFGIQAGYFGIWGYQEVKLSNQFTLRGELGLDGDFWKLDNSAERGVLFSPEFSLEPRWYYNLNARHRKSKETAGNSGNFLTLKTRFRPDWFVVSNRNNLSVVSNLAILPTWGIRRNLGSHFNYEAGFGIGYARYLDADHIDRFLQEKGEATINIHLRIGYRF